MDARACVAIVAPSRAGWPRTVRIMMLALLTCTFQGLNLPATGGPIRKGDDSLMSPKAHGSTATPVQEPLRWGVKTELASDICCNNRNGAEPNMYFTECRDFTKQLRWQRGVDLSNVEPIVFYDSVSGLPLFVAPVGRDVDAFLSESLRHGAPR